MKKRIEHIKHLATLVRISIETLYANKKFLDDEDKLDLLESSRKLQALFQGQHPRYSIQNINQAQKATDQNGKGA